MNRVIPETQQHHELGQKMKTASISAENALAVMKNPQGYAPKKIAVLTSTLGQIAGSEIVAIEVATHYANLGHDVTLWARDYSSAVREAIKNRVKVAENPIDITDFDFVWSQHGSYLQNIGDRDRLAAWNGALVSVHLSHFTPLEIFDHPLAKKYLGARVFHCELSMDTLEYPDTSSDELFLFRNAAPARFHREPEGDPRKLKKVLIVSNHLPTEVEAAANLLVSHGIDVRILGRKHEVKLIAPDDVWAADAVISIGKTVQYALVAGVPVYCYDHFGGPGWLTDNNFERAEYYNFNGKCCTTKRTPEEIVEDFLLGFNSSQSFTVKKWEYFSDRYNLEKYLTEILAKAKTHHVRGEAAICEIEAAATLSKASLKYQQKASRYKKITNRLLALVVFQFALITFLLV